ncbi:unnamed protein product [Ranitomeya imitator]|uniref:CCHC-type domain-containing protein n=1 Tax=Ranitomeya imitator TaxID=111125 RepID=A0ABN9KXJ6_9NEOB|nr:unnamed protein product [Ranitomeya imitator]
MHSSDGSARRASVTASIRGPTEEVESSEKPRYVVTDGSWDGDGEVGLFMGMLKCARIRVGNSEHMKSGSQAEKWSGNRIQKKKSDKGKSDIFQVKRFFKVFDKEATKTINPKDDQGSDEKSVPGDHVDYKKGNEETSQIKGSLMPFIPDAEEIDLSWNELVGGSMMLLTPHLGHVSSLRILSLSNCGLTADDVGALGEALEHIPNLQVLDLSWNNGLGGALSRLTQHFTSNCELKSLNLTECSLKAEDGDSLAQAISKMSRIEVLELSENKELGSTMKNITEEKLKMLIFVGFETALYVLTSGRRSAFQYWPYLRKLDLSCNKATGGGFCEAAARLTAFKQLEMLDIHQCCLSRADVTALTQVIPLLSNLQFLDISSNKNIGLSSEHLFSRLRFLPKLKSVNISNCTLKKESFAGLAEASHYLMDLQMLDLSWNKCVGGNLNLLSGALQSATGLQSLLLSSCNLVTQDLAVIGSNICTRWMYEMEHHPAAEFDPFYYLEYKRPWFSWLCALGRVVNSVAEFTSVVTSGIAVSGLPPSDIRVLQDTVVDMDIQALCSSMDNLVVNVQKIQDTIDQKSMLEPRIPIPDLFFGDRTKFLSFRNNCKLFLALKPHSSGNPIQQVLIIISFLRGDPQDWAFSLAPGDSALSNVDAFFQALGLLYDELNSVDQAEKNLLALCQGQDDVEVYCQKFRKWSVLTLWNESALAALFRKGLSEALKDVMVGFPMPAGLNESMSLAIQIGRRLRERKSVHHLAVLSERKPEPMQCDRTMTKVERQEHRRLNRLCFYCGDSTHAISNCPKRTRRFDSSAVIGTVQSKFLLSITLMCSLSSYSVMAFVDSGAALNLMDLDYAKRCGFFLEPLRCPIPLRGIDATPFGQE